MPVCKRVMARALDLDEVHDIGTVHPTASIIPATLAAAEAVGGISGKEYIAANALELTYMQIKPYPGRGGLRQWYGRVLSGGTLGALPQLVNFSD